MENLVMVFLKEPVPGKVKTRLAAGVGPEQAASHYRWMVARTLESLPDEAAVWIVFDPPDREVAVREWIGGVVADRPGFGDWRFVAQAAGDLGNRLESAFLEAFEDGFRRVVVIGTDCVDLDADGIRAAWRALDGADGVFGPARDGGYYLLGLAGPAPELFRGIPWSTRETLGASLAAAGTAGRRLHLLPTLEDVDTLEDWRRVRGRPGA